MTEISKSSGHSSSVEHLPVLPDLNNCARDDHFNFDETATLINHIPVVGNSYGAVDIEEENLETSQIIETLHIYKRRWYVLGIFSVVAFLQGGLCSVWSVIAPSAEEVFQWSDQDISLMQIWIYASYLIAMIPFAIYVDRKGLKQPMVLTCGLLVAGTFLRCISFTPPSVLWLAHLGHMVIGAAGPLAFTAGPIISALWFPAHQRATATAISTIAGYAGGAGCFLFGPMMVNAPEEAPIFPATTLSPMLPTNQTNIEVMEWQIRKCRYIEFGICSVVFLLVCIYFPSKPPKSPTLTAAIGKLDLFSGFKKLFSKELGNFWLVCFAYCIPVSIYGVWNGLLGVNLKGLVSESQVGWLGFAGVMSGCVTGVLLGRLSDMFVGKMKMFVMIMITGFIISTFWFILLSHRYIEFSAVQLYAASVLQGLFNNGAVPLYYELGIEATYPVAEICVTTIMTFVYNFIPLFFLVIFFIPNVGTVWMDWVLFASGLLSFPIFLSFKELYKRSMIDKGGEKIPEGLLNSSMHESGEFHQSRDHHVTA